MEAAPSLSTVNVPHNLMEKPILPEQKNAMTSEALAGSPCTCLRIRSEMY